MDTNIYEGAVRSALKEFSLQQAIALSLICCDRVGSYYDRFSRAETWGNPGKLRNARTAVYNWLKGVNTDYKRQSASLEVEIPDSDDFGPVELGGFMRGTKYEGAHFEYFSSLLGPQGQKVKVEQLKAPQGFTLL